jgi:hypothetical protein
MYIKSLLCARYWDAAMNKPRRKPYPQGNYILLWRKQTKKNKMHSDKSSRQKAQRELRGARREGIGK